MEYLVDKGADFKIQDQKGVIMYDYSNDGVVLLIWVCVSHMHWQLNVSLVFSGFEPTISGNLLVYTHKACLLHLSEYYYNYCVDLFSYLYQWTSLHIAAREG